MRKKLKKQIKISWVKVNKKQRNLKKRKKKIQMKKKINTILMMRMKTLKRKLIRLRFKKRTKKTNSISLLHLSTCFQPSYSDGMGTSQ